MIEIPVELGERRYVVAIGHGLARMIPELLAPLRGHRIVIVSNPRVWGLHGRSVEGPLRALGTVRRTLVPDGERYKSRPTLEAVQDAFLAAGLTRADVVVAFGGGVVSDVAGFAAATYMRGVAWIPIPTTLLAMVDSALGGKVGINHPRAKNLIGAFHQPRAVIVDPSFLSTLPPRQRRSGAYEVLKCGILGDRALFRAIQRAPPELRDWSRVDLEGAVASACRIKAEVVEKDERERGLRRILNLGHTLGHALEAVTRYRRFTHGEAVGWGMVGAAHIARRRRLLTETAFDAIASTVDRLGPRPPVADLALERVLDAVSRDKKARGARATFVLPVAVGRVEVHDDVERDEIRRALRVMAARQARLA